MTVQPASNTSGEVRSPVSRRTNEPVGLVTSVLQVGSEELDINIVRVVRHHSILLFSDRIIKMKVLPV